MNHGYWISALSAMRSVGLTTPGTLNVHTPVRRAA